jgi:hypothetical protein
LGEVSWRGVISPEGPAIIAAAGNVFQAGTALLALIVALVASAPAIVALASYSYLWIAFSCLIFYPLVSLAAWNYDFAILYGSPDNALSGLLPAYIYFWPGDLFTLSFPIAQG